MKADWGVPNWRDARAYPGSEALNYRALWKAVAVDRSEGGCSVDSESGERTFYPGDRHSLLLNFQLNALLDPRVSHPYLKLSAHHHSLNVTAKPQTGTAHQTLTQIKPLVEHFGVSILDQEIEEDRRKSEAAEAAGIMLYTFDLSQPLGTQLDRAEATLLFWQERRFGKLNSSKTHRGSRALYLRALDAKDSGATYSAIAQEFWPDQEKTPQSARDTYKAACRLRDNYPI
jgi:hypothetical protein